MISLVDNIGVYVLVYLLATVGCAVGTGRALRVEDAETRTGLLGLLVGSGGWALLQTLFLVAPTYQVAYLSYVASLVVGLSSIYAWLYFASAFTGRTLHRSRVWRQVAVVSFLLIVGLKLTNPLHGSYFDITWTTEPFAHYATTHGVSHWVITGASYVAAGIGFFMLFEAFTEADYDTLPLAGLSVLTAAPVGLDLLGYTTDVFIEMNYEPIGVAVFAVGALFVFRDRFFVVQASDTTQKPLLYFDANDRLRDYNDHAEVVYPEIRRRCGDSLTAAFPDIAAALDTETAIVERDAGEGAGYYLVTETQASHAGPSDSRVIHLTDVTGAERRRRELDRHNQQLESISAGLRHELLNQLNILQGWIRETERAVTDGDTDSAEDALETVNDAGDRAVDIIEDFVSLTQYGTTLDGTSRLSLESVVVEARTATDTDVSLLVAADETVEGSRSRLVHMVTSAAEFAAANGADSLAVGVDGDAVTFTDDGDPVGDETNPDDYFDLDAAVPNSRAGLALPKVRVLAQLHGWTVRLDEGYETGVRVVVATSGAGRGPVTSTPTETTASTSEPAEEPQSSQASTSTESGRENRLPSVVPDGLRQRARGWTSDD
ncbi:histidine kinase N-terminal 7TM domain-containing protein [Halobaculum sp. MBLA0143]|uniref:sensor histidine kinase n=1 Tax=Halobaculum sp. MBLA0143 TaxID=3079933 RepID=UPI00352578BF